RFKCPQCLCGIEHYSRRSKAAHRNVLLYYGRIKPFRIQIKHLMQGKIVELPGKSIRNIMAHVRTCNNYDRTTRMADRPGYTFTNSLTVLQGRVHHSNRDYPGVI